jgi:hypothetical protein
MIHCTNCNQIIGRYQIFSHAFDEIDTGDAEFNEDMAELLKLKTTGKLLS